MSELNPDGSALLYSTYLGGSAYVETDFGDTANGIVVDEAGHAYIRMQCQSPEPVWDGRPAFTNVSGTR
jgi:hypothetical protein